LNKRTATKDCPPSSKKSSFTPTSLSQADRNNVLSLLAGRLFHFDFQQAQDSSALLQLAPIES